MISIIKIFMEILPFIIFYLLTLRILQAQNSCIYVNMIVHDVNEMTQIIADVVADPTLPR